LRFDGGEKNCPAIPIAPLNSFVKRINNIMTFQRAKDRRKRESYSIGWNVWILGPVECGPVVPCNTTAGKYCCMLPWGEEEGSRYPGLPRLV
jgi:hypothetical protein